MITTNAGRSGFIWWFGTVEDVNDPLMLGRLRVRIINMQTDNSVLLSTEDLHWAQVIQPIYSAALNGIGISPTGIVVGSTVIGFFGDGKEGQLPIVFGSLAGIPDNHDVNGLAREINTINKQYVPLVEPHSKYNAKYPHNKTLTTESGHAIEIDDTPGAERIHIFHKSGTYNEIDNVGNRVEKTVSNTVFVTVDSKTEYVGGELVVGVAGNTGFSIGNDFGIGVENDFEIVSKKGNIHIKTESGSINIDVVGGDMNIKVDGNVNISAEKNVNIKGKMVNIDGSSAVNITGGKINLN